MHATSRVYPRRLLLAGVCAALPPGRVIDAGFTLAALLRAAGPMGLSWLGAALTQVPDSVATNEDKERFMGTCIGVHAMQLCVYMSM